MEFFSFSPGRPSSCPSVHCLSVSHPLHDQSGLFFIQHSGFPAMLDSTFSFLLIFLEVQLIYNFMLVSDVQQSDSIMCCAKLYPTIWDPYGLQLPHLRLLCPWDPPGKNTGDGCHALLQGIFPTQGSNPGIPHCRWILYKLSNQGSPVQYKWYHIFVILCLAYFT